MSEPHRPTEEAVRQIAHQSGIEVPEEELAEQVRRTTERLKATRAWRECGLGFSFDDEAGTFEYVPPAHVHRHRWDVPTPMNGNRGATEDEDSEAVKRDHDDYE